MVDTPRADFDDQNATIFIAICAYRDPELRATITDCIEHARHSERLYFGICNQFDRDTFVAESEFSNTRILSVPYFKSTGLGWARSQAQTLYDKQKFVLQMDSHMRFKSGWDDYQVSVFRRALNDGIRLPIVTAACPESGPERKRFLTDKGTKIGFKKFFDRGTIEYQPDWLSAEEQKLPYVRGVFVSGHYLFASGDFYQEYRFDPEIYFGGEETCLSVRSFTMGYDVIHPSHSYLYHDYNRATRNLHWLDHAIHERDEISTRRIRQVLEIEDYGIDLGNYGLGDRRTLDDWITISGIDIRRSEVLLGKWRAENPGNQ